MAVRLFKERRVTFETAVWALGHSGHTRAEVVRWIREMKECVI
jgi:hypothetical protein